MNKDIRTLSHVPRWTIIRTLRTQSVADHSYYVVLYSGMIGELCHMNDKDMRGLLWYAALHDIDELVTGDIPSPVKHPAHGRAREVHGISVPGDAVAATGTPTEPPVDPYDVAGIINPWVTDEILKVVKLADIMDATFFICDEISMGNDELRELKVHLIGIMDDRLTEFPARVRSEVSNMLYKHERTLPRLIT